METTMLIEVTDPKAIGLIHELEVLQLIKVLKTNTVGNTPKLSEKYRGVFTTDDARQFDAHTQQLRGEWPTI